ncbi:MAG: hypothetical protein CYG61_11080 [Actinobacteria bacterium]|nr:MAG: hypothetical protein CYG61_11080 [Actinomycetota bacterium]
MTTRALGTDRKPDELLRERWDWSVVPAGPEPNCCPAWLERAVAMRRPARCSGPTLLAGALLVLLAERASHGDDHVPRLAELGLAPGHPLTETAAPWALAGMEPHRVTIECVLLRPGQHSTSAGGTGAREA